MKKVLLLLSVVAILTMAAAPAALARGGHAGMGMGAGMALCPCMKEKLALTEDQVKKVDELKAGFEKKIAPDMKKLKTKKEEMMKLWMAAKPNRKAILTKKAQINKIKMKVGTLKVDAHLKMLKILTADQKKKMGEVMKTCATDCKGMAHHEGCTCPKCAKKDAAGDKPAEKKPDCEGCPGDCGHK
ncbi:MAG TPA: periplasmic heavy metal sensor [Myxococcota bacterium]|nr:periplasmic heavy metal sensor [Myxococcota bacterium]